MKLTKKLICVAMVAAMSLTSLTAFATVPTPKDNTQAFIYAENYFNQGLYYEAMEELNYVQPIYSLEQEKLTVWIHKVQDKITAWEISEAFRKVSEDYEKNEVVAASNRLHGSLSPYAITGSLTVTEAAAYDAWVNELKKGINTEAKAIVAVEDFIGDILWDPDMYYSVVPFGNGWDVYVKSHKTDHNIAAYHVAKDLIDGDANGDSVVAVYADGTVEKIANVSYTEVDYNGNPASEYEWRNDTTDTTKTGIPFPGWLEDAGSVNPPINMPH